MLIRLLRHGATACNAEGRYQGVEDIPLSPAGRAALRRADCSPQHVYVSPLSRAVETAAILFPDARQFPVADLREMDFGIFAGRNFQEMEHDERYRTWVDSGCTERCPGGESRGEFSSRVCGAFEKLVDNALNQRAAELVIVAHGGVQMAALDRFAVPRREYFNWRAPCGGGFLLDAAPWQEHRLLQFIQEICYTED